MLYQQTQEIKLYKISSLELNIYYDLIKYNSSAIVTTGGVFINYSRDMLGTGRLTKANNNSSEYFHSLYFGGNISVGIRIDAGKSNLVYEFKPINIHLGNNGFMLKYLMFGIDFKLKK